MIGMKSIYQSLDETHKGLVRFGDRFLIRYEGKVEVHVDCTNDKKI